MTPPSPPAGAQFGPVEALARGVLQIADAAGMPDTYWQTNTAVAVARSVLGVPPDGRYTHSHLWEEGT